MTLYGLLSGTAGSVIIALLSVILTPLSPNANDISFKFNLFSLITVGGIIGTVLDSILGATLQASVIDVKQGKIIEGDGGTKVLVNSSSSMEKIVGHDVRKRGDNKAAADAGQASDKDGVPSRKIATGRDLVSNNAVNCLMAGSVAVMGIVAALKVLV